MLLRPSPGDELTIDDQSYRIAEHPAAPGMAYGQSGRRGTVYQLVENTGKTWALKVFSPRYREPRLVGHAQRIRAWSSFPGLRVSERRVLSASRNKTLLREIPDLTYAVLMPWIEGKTWTELLLSREPFTPDTSLALAEALLEVLVGMEEQGLAHCDLSGPNVIVTDQSGFELVDLEEVYGPELTKPETLPGGSPGYAHKTAPEGLWAAEADRFAGAVLLGEMLGGCDDRVRKAGWGEGHFDPDEMQMESDRYRTLHTVLGERWGERVAKLLEQVWFSDSLLDCPTFAEWAVALPGEVSEAEMHVVATALPHEPEVKDGSEDGVEPVAPPIMEGEIDELVETPEWVDTHTEEPPSAAVEEVALWQCAACGRDVYLDHAICPYCEQGRRDEQRVYERVLEEVGVLPALKVERRKLPIWAIISGIAVIVLLAGGVGGALNKRSQTEKATATAVAVAAAWTEAAAETATARPTLTPNPTATPSPSSTASITPSATITSTPEPIAISPDNVNRVVQLNSVKIQLDNETIKAISPSGKEVGVVGKDHIRILDISSLQELKRVDGDEDRFDYSLAWSQDGSMIAIAGGSDNTVRVWDANSGEQLFALSGHLQPVNILAWSPDGNRLASTEYGPAFRVWDLVDPPYLDGTIVYQHSFFLPAKFSIHNRRNR